MNTTRLGSLLLTVSVASFAHASLATHEDGVILVKMKPGYSSSVVDAPIGATIKRQLAAGNWHSVQLPKGVSLERGLAYYRASAGVEAAEINFKNELFKTVNDPKANQQWWIPVVKAPQAWDLTTGSASVTVAICDTGVDYNHEDLKSKIAPGGYDVSDKDSDPMDYQGHGTHCAGIAAAATNNGIGVAGMGYNVRILPVKVFPNSFDDVVAEGITYATDHGAKVVSLSLGRLADSSAILQDAVNYATSKGVVVVAAAGNNGIDVTTTGFVPSNLDNVFNVAATNSADQRASFSNYSRTRVAVAAPGEDIFSTLWPGAYASESGTSMACPMVAGLVGLVRSYAPSATGKEVVNAIMKTADNVGPFVKSGRINAYKAVDFFTISKPLPATLVSKDVFQGSKVAGGAAYMTLLSEGIRNLGQVAGVTSVYKMPAQPIAQLRTSEIVAKFSPVPSATVQLFLWNFATNKYDLMSSVPGTTGSVSYSPGIIPTSYYDQKTHQFGLVVRSLVPNRVGNSSAQYKFTVNSLTATFGYRQNP